jgi:hypothetical protein
MDVLAFHGYDNMVAESIPGLITSYRSIMTSHGVGTLPLFDTEAGWAAWNASAYITAPAAQAAYLAKYFLLHWSSNAARFVWYAYDGQPIWGQLWTLAGGMNVAGTAYSQVSDWMVGASMTGPCAISGSGIWSCSLARPGGYEALVVWDSTGTKSLQTPAKYVQYCDLSGNVTKLGVQQTISVGNSPVLLETGDAPAN